MSQGCYPYFRVIESAQDTEVIVGGRRMLMMGSNSYLGLTNHPKVKEAAIKAIERYGTGCAGSRFLNGTLDLHIELEQKLAAFGEKEAALAFSTGFQTNLGAISALVNRGDVVIIDNTDHASIVDGSRLSFGKTVRFDHNNVTDLERVLGNCPPKAGKMIVVDGIYSMEGDIALLPEIVALAKAHDAAVMVDDAHAIGVLGPRGNGTALHFGLNDDVDVLMGTFSKSLASVGGFVAASKEIIQYLKHHARSMIFSASMPPACAASVIAALDITINEPERRERLWSNTRRMLASLKQLGFDTGMSETPIIPIVVGDDMVACQMWKILQDEGLFVNPVVPPAVPPGRALIRIAVMATHTDDHLDFALEKLTKAGKMLHLI
ncbi:aminotransferase class I/II-fold pyridoxal phosphate-dependent enzyme [Candidatus Sumerlaeota bacterium]|nr:aminotransferase class I/II-fold pyridoxal phosphate-dependent enzyme [Candidatus Sumerlaeota bacterium]